MKKYFLLILAVLLFLSWSAYVFVASVAHGKPWQMWFSGVGLFLVLVVTLVLTIGLARKAR